MLDIQEVRKYLSESQAKEFVKLHSDKTLNIPANERKPVRSRVRKVKEGHIARPMNSYLCYTKDKKPIFTLFDFAIKQQGFHRICAKWWKAESEAVKLKYHKQAEQHKTDHMIKYPHYKYRPQLKTAKRSRKDAFDDVHQDDSYYPSYPKRVCRDNGLPMVKSQSSDQGYHSLQRDTSSYSMLNDPSYNPYMYMNPLAPLQGGDVLFESDAPSMEHNFSNESDLSPNNDAEYNYSYPSSWDQSFYKNNVGYYPSPYVNPNYLFNTPSSQSMSTPMLDNSLSPPRRDSSSVSPGRDTPLVQELAGYLSPLKMHLTEDIGVTSNQSSYQMGWSTIRAQAETWN